MQAGISRKQLRSKKVQLINSSDIFGRQCRACGKADTWNFGEGKCSYCSSKEIPFLLCPYCQVALDDTQLMYSAIGKGNTRISEELLADYCKSCQRRFLWPARLDQLDSFASSAPPNFQLLPEVGICTPDFLEVLVEANDNSGSEEINIRRASNKLSARIGPQTRLFEKSLDFITRHDLDDYGHWESLTLKIRPGPPYTKQDRETIYLLLSRIRNSGITMSFWSVHFNPWINFPGTEEDVVGELIKTIMSWKIDKRRDILWLINKIDFLEYPGTFVNTFRLLELVLDRLIDHDIANSRRLMFVNDEKFAEIARSYNLDLKSKLKKRIESLSVYPRHVLGDLWKVILPQGEFRENEVYAAVIRFRNENIHPPRISASEIALPWEVPPFELFSHHLLRLVLFIIRDSIGNTAVKGS